MKNLFTAKFKQRMFVLFLFAAGLFATGTAKAACTANLMFFATHLSVTFTDSNSSALAHPHSATWTFGDSTTGTGDNPHHTYSANGTYHVCVTVYDSSTSCSASYCKNIYVNNCTLAPTYTYTVSGRTVSFTNTTSISGTATYTWHFGDGIVDSTSGATVSHTYSGTQNTFSSYLTVYEHSSTCVASGYVNVIICLASSRINYHFSGHSVQFSADSNNTAAISYRWDFGDSSTSTSDYPYHTYSSVGIYHVCLTATDSVTSCTTTTCVTIQIADPTYCISGDARIGSGIIGDAMVYLISFNASDSSLSALDSMKLRDSITGYHFCGLANGTYYTKAALLSTNANYGSYIPTYHSSATYWASAAAITVSGANVSGANITMTSGTNPGGPGFIGGLISAGANKVGDPIAGILVILYNSGQKPVGYTHSDINGRYAFSSLAYDTYTLLVEIPGKICHPDTIVLNAANKQVTDADMSVHLKSISPGSNSGIAPQNFESGFVNIFPNPVIDHLIINTSLKNAQIATVQVFDVTGKVVAAFDQDVAAGNQSITCDGHTLPGGMYLVKILLAKDHKILEGRFVKGQ